MLAVPAPGDAGATRANWQAPETKPDVPKMKLGFTLAADAIPGVRDFRLWLQSFQGVQLLDWPGRELGADKAGTISDGMPPILERLQITEQCWGQLIAGFSRIFRRVAGTLASILADSAKRGALRSAAIHQSRSLFA